MLILTKAAAAAAKSLQSCLTLCDPIDGSPPGSPIPGILQARTLEWVGISFSNAWMWKVKVNLLSHVRLFATPWTAAYQAPLPIGFSRQEYWSGVPLPSPLPLWHNINLRASSIEITFNLLTCNTHGTKSLITSKVVVSQQAPMVQSKEIDSCQSDHLPIVTPQNIKFGGRT